jgi:comEA protein
MWRRWIDWLALTSAERNVILFLAGAFLIGSGLRLYGAMYPDTPAHDYRTSDSLFVVLSRATDSTADEAAKPSSARVNINTASKKELMELPGIGEVIAERIMLYRQDEGRFKDIADLTKVRGISQRKLEQLKPFITVE